MKSDIREQLAGVIHELESEVGFRSSCDINLNDILSQKPEVRRDKLAILTHPFFNLRGDYESRLNGFIEDFPYPIVVLSYDFEGDSARIGTLSPHKEHFYLDCGYTVAFPKAGWDITARIINSFSAEEILMGGANLSYDEFGYPAQCVGFSYRCLKLRVPNLRLHEEICNI
jgi:hypothetical protein